MADVPMPGWTFEIDTTAAVPHVSAEDIRRLWNGTPMPPMPRPQDPDVPSRGWVDIGTVRSGTIRIAPGRVLTRSAEGEDAWVDLVGDRSDPHTVRIDGHPVVPGDRHLWIGKGDVRNGIWRVTPPDGQSKHAMSHEYDLQGSNDRQETEMDTDYTNPYDRRSTERGQTRRLSGDVNFGGGMLRGVGGIQYADGAGRSPLALEDIEALVGSATARARADTEERSRVSQAEEVRRSMATAYDEGHAVGDMRGAARIVDRLDRLYAARVRAITDHAGETLEALDGGSRDITKQRLAAVLRDTAGMLHELVHAHHAGFPDGGTPAAAQPGDPF